MYEALSDGGLHARRMSVSVLRIVKQALAAGREKQFHLAMVDGLVEISQFVQARKGPLQNSNRIAHASFVTKTNRLHSYYCGGCA